jgi:hypothetical protein
MTRCLRWVLLAPAVAGSWYLIVYISGSYYQRLTSKCSSAPDLAQCTTFWYLVQSNLLPALAAVVSAVTVVLVAYLVSPAKKLNAARVFFSAGASFATIAGVFLGLLGQLQLLIAAVFAVAAGALTTVLVTRMHEKAAGEVRSTRAA